MEFGGKGRPLSEAGMHAALLGLGTDLAADMPEMPRVDEAS